MQQQYIVEPQYRNIDLKHFRFIIPLKQNFVVYLI